MLAYASPSGLYVFKGNGQDTLLGSFLFLSPTSHNSTRLVGFRADLFHVHRQRADCLGRDRMVTDVP